MAARNTERLLNLVIALLVTPRFISREQIRDLVDGYSQAKSEAGFRRMFERDKEDLRQMGVQILLGPTDPYSDEMDGYRIKPDDFYLPEIHLTAEESTLVALASSVWNESMMTQDVSAAMAKLSATGAQITHDGLSFLAPRLTASEEGFTVLWQGLLTSTPVAFTYHGRIRHVRPWRMISRSGAWYLLGEDMDAGVRMFRLNRMEDRPVTDGEPGSFTPPPPEVINSYSSSLEPGEPVASVLVAIRTSAAGGLRRRGTPVEGEAPHGYDLMRIGYVRPDEIVSAICAAGADVLVVEDGSIRDQVIARLRAVAEGGTR